MDEQCDSAGDVLDQGSNGSPPTLTVEATTPGEAEVEYIQVPDEVKALREELAEVQGKLKRTREAAKSVSDSHLRFWEEQKTLKADLEEAVDLAHRLLAKSFPTLSYLRERKGDLFVTGRALLKKHGRYEDA